MACANCGAETIAALTRGGRAVDIEHDHVWVRADEPWPMGVFIVGVSGGPHGPAIAHAIPAIALVDRREDQRPSGPFRREHLCG